MSTAAVIPIKQFRDVKQRLASILMRGAGCACASDVEGRARCLGTVSAYRCLVFDQRDPFVRDIAAEFDVETIEEPAEAGLIGAVQHAGSVLAGREPNACCFSQETCRS